MPVTQVPPGLGTAISGEEWARFVLTRLGHASVVLRSGARRLTTSAPVLHVPRFTGDGSAGWYLELEEIAEGAPPGDDIEMVMRKCATLAKISSEVVSDADRAAINQVGEEMMRAVGLDRRPRHLQRRRPAAPARRDRRADRPGDRRGRHRPRQRDRRRRPDRRRRRRSQRALPEPVGLDRVAEGPRRRRPAIAAARRHAGRRAAARRTERLPHPGADRAGPPSWRSQTRSSSRSATTRASRCQTRRCSPPTVTSPGSRRGWTARSTTSAAWRRSCRPPAPRPASGEAKAGSAQALDRAPTKWPTRSSSRPAGSRRLPRAVRRSSSPTTQASTFGACAATTSTPSAASATSASAAAQLEAENEHLKRRSSRSR